ncbi:MAG TPA: hypothetical protein VFD91_02215 [Mariniphaga sp.]|nr:hypothetical protein [Mariniphaga sp.]
MFTLGIFTTHLPYIALVMFYAFFWMIGFDTGSAEKLQTGKSLISVEQAYEHHLEQSIHHYFYEKDKNDKGCYGSQVPFIFRPLKKLIHNGYYLIKHNSCTFKGILFNRPPPVIF